MKRKKQKSAPISGQRKPPTYVKRGKRTEVPASRVFWNDADAEMVDGNTYEQTRSAEAQDITQLSAGQRRRHLDERLVMLHRRAMIIETELRKLEDRRHYRACIFGSARIQPDSPEYKQVFVLARQMAWRGIDILTGGGPGLMEAANRGATLGREEKKTKAVSFGLSIQLEWEPEPNHHLDIKRHHLKFSSRLDDFMRLSHSIVVTPGGIGTLLELFFSWQLIQVNHIEPRPIVLLNKEFWGGLIDWMQDKPLSKGLFSLKDLESLHIVDSVEETVEIISAHHAEFMRARDRSRTGQKSPRARR